MVTTLSSNQELIDRLNACTLNAKDLLPEDEGDFGIIEIDADDGEEATYCPDCENVYEFGDEGFEAIVCPDCGGCNMHEIIWIGETDEEANQRLNLETT